MILIITWLNKFMQSTLTSFYKKESIDSNELINKLNYTAHVQRSQSIEPITY